MSDDDRTYKCIGCDIMYHLDEIHRRVLHTMCVCEGCASEEEEPPTIPEKDHGI